MLIKLRKRNQIYLYSLFAKKITPDKNIIKDGKLNNEKMGN